jgi:PAS domain S-box-containing protein
MIKPIRPENESERLAALRSYEILDTLPEESFDDLAKLAAHICGTPFAVLSLVDEARQWFKARIGVEQQETERDISFCAHGILQAGLLIVPDATKDVRFMDNPLVTGEPHVHFYAGAPLITAEGQALGMLCVTDSKPRNLSPSQTDALRRLAGQAVAQMELRKRTRESQQQKEQLQLLAQRLSLATKAAGIGVWDWDVHGDELAWDETMLNIYGTSRDAAINHELWKNAVLPDDLAQAEAALQEVICKKGRGEMEFRIRQPDGSVRHLQAAMDVTLDKDQNVTRLVGVNLDVTERKQREAEREKFIAELQQLLSEVKTLSGLIPICGWCKSVRSDTGYWQTVEDYVRAHAEVSFSHGICPTCKAKFFAEFDQAKGGSTAHPVGS